MSLFSWFHHYLLPHHTNNFRARLLHNTGIFFIVGILLSANLLLRLFDSTSAHILGFTSSITIDEVVRATNEKRISAGLAPLSYNEKLADAARRKAANMLEENYWAHNSPSGKSPWVWFQAAGYNYTYAGENLAKDFGSTPRMIDAWMASPTHRDNIVSSKYTDIGIAVVPGALSGSDTVLVVQLFGTTSPGVVAAPRATAATPATSAQPDSRTPLIAPVTPVEPIPAVKSATPDSVQAVINEVAVPQISEFNLRKILSLATTLLFILVLVLDLVVAESKSLSRRVGKNWAHIIFINFILLAVTVVNAGKIM